MIFVIGYIIGMFFTAIAATNFLITHVGFNRDSYEERIEATMLGLLAGLVWPFTLLGMGVYRFIFMPLDRDKVKDK